MENFSDAMQTQPPLRLRARSDAHKGLRREALMEAATQLFLAQRYEAVTMQSVARVCGLSKASVFVYFPTKESLFLAIAEREIAHFFDALAGDLQAIPSPGGAPVVASALGRAYARRPTLVRLLGVLHRVLESKLSPSDARDFRWRLLPGMARVGRVVEAHLPFLPSHGGRELLLAIHCIALGVQQLAEVGQVHESAGDLPGMELFRFDFQNMFLPMVAAYLRGLQCPAETLGTPNDPRTLP
jgi:AcrR family transcriptional regulator